jgi:hypothetical protein
MCWLTPPGKFVPDSGARESLEPVSWKRRIHFRSKMCLSRALSLFARAAQSETGYYYAVQMFGRPRSKSITFRVANKSGTTVEY